MQKKNKKNQLTAEQEKKQIMDNKINDIFDFLFKQAIRL